MNYIIVFLINLLALNFRLWLFQSIFHRKQRKRTIFVLVLVMWIISACAMLAYPLLLEYVNVTTFSAESLSRQNIALLISYVGIIWLLLALFGKKLSLGHKLFIRSSAFLTLAVGIAIWAIALPVWVILYFLCVAWAEEFLKLSVGQSFFAQYNISKKDLLLFAILSAIGFALIENIIYVFYNPTVGLAISRSLTTVVMHILFTGTMAYIIAARSGKNRWRYILAFLIGMALHRGYNTVINYQTPRMTAIIIILGYFIVSYFLYKSDRLYLGK